MTKLDLVGVAEAAELLGVSKRRVRELQDRHATFPRPVAELAAGPVWLRRDVEAWLSTWPRRIGRPPAPKPLKSNLRRGVVPRRWPTST